MSDVGITVGNTGRCLCGSIRYVVRGALRPVVACHCSQCRRMTGHFMAATAARRTDIEMTSTENLQWYEASEKARRGFCGRCGSTLFWDGKDHDYISIAAGSLDLPTRVHLAQHIFTAEKGDYYVIEDGVPQSTDGKFSISIPG